MTEQQRREQILQARRQTEQTRAAAPAMSDAEATAIASENQGLTQEQVIAIAMLVNLFRMILLELRNHL